MLFVRENTEGEYSGVGGRRTPGFAHEVGDRDGRLHARGRRARGRARLRPRRAAPRPSDERDEVERVAVRLRALGRGRRGGRCGLPGRAGRPRPRRRAGGADGQQPASASTWSSPRTSSATSSPTSPARCRAAWAWPRARASRPARPRGDLRARPRLGARHRRQGPREPDRRDLERGAAARHLGETEAAARLLRAVESVCKEGPHTRDVGGTGSTSEVGDAVAGCV